MASKIVKRHQDTILNSINEGVFTVDLNWLITSFNRAAEKITRVRSMDAIGRPCGEVFRTSICETACPMKQTLATGKPMVNVMTRIVTQSGNQIPIRLSTAPLKEKDGTVVGGVETVQDLTQVEQLRKALEANYTLKTSQGGSPWPKVAPFCWMKSAISRRQCRFGCCGCCRKNGSNPWAPFTLSRWMYAWWPPPIKI